MLPQRMQVCPAARSSMTFLTSPVITTSPSGPRYNLVGSFEAGEEPPNSFFQMLIVFWFRVCSLFLRCAQCFLTIIRRLVHKALRRLIPYLSIDPYNISDISYYSNDHGSGHDTQNYCHPYRNGWQHSICEDCKAHSADGPAA